jgi:hypothetical protein
MKIYLAGFIPKGDYEAKEFVDWRVRYVDALKNTFAAEFIDPSKKGVDEAKFLEVLGSDCRHIKESTFVIFNIEERLGAGTAQEMVIAKYFEKPTVAVLPRETYHRRSNISFNGVVIEDWIHPFVASFADWIVEDVKEIPQLREQILTAKPKTLSIIDEAIENIYTLENGN